jgi:hypothetical protein
MSLLYPRRESEVIPGTADNTLSPWFVWIFFKVFKFFPSLSHKMDMHKCKFGAESAL